MILCLNCKSENPDDVKFCGYCSNSLAKVCPACHSQNPPQFNFCGQCRADLDAYNISSTPLNPAGDSAGSLPFPDAERRQLTVMFCDLKDSTKLSSELDPETLSEALSEYREACADVIERFQGIVAKYLGDGMMVFFGYPQAHDDDPRRAVLAGLGITRAMKELNVRLKEKFKIAMDVRIGIDTGRVVVGKMGHGKTLEEMAVVGNPPNIAAKIQEVSPLNSVVVSENTHRLIQGFFDSDEMPHDKLAGIPQPLRVYHVTGETGAQNYLDLFDTHRLTPLVGRDKEQDLIQDQWKKAKEGNGQIVLISGEAGIGKSRLIHRFKQQIASETYLPLESQCVEINENSAFYPIITLLQQAFEFDRDDSPDRKFQKLEEALEPYDISSPEAIPLFASLLSLPSPEGRHNVLNMTSQRQRQRTMESLLEVLEQVASRDPVVLVIEDLHWADASTMEFLTRLVNKGSPEGVLTLLTYRNDFVPPWKDSKELNRIALKNLPGREVEAIIDHLTDGRPLPARVQNELLAKTGGNPLYTEELTKMVLESGFVTEANGGYEINPSSPPMDIPDTLQDMLMARLDRLFGVKEVAQLAATVGREFPYELLHSVSPASEQQLRNALEKLVDAEVLFQEGILPEASYTFKHSLIRDAAYNSLLNRTRQGYHSRIAGALERQFTNKENPNPEILAHHFTEAGLGESAIPYWHLAGQSAMERSANVEGAQHFQRGIDLVKKLDESLERYRQEIVLHVSLGMTLIFTKGYADPDVEYNFAHAQELCGLVGDTPQLYPALYGLWAYHLVRANYDNAYKIGSQLLALGTAQNDTDLLLEAHTTQGLNYFWKGDLGSARKHFEQTIQLYDRKQHAEHANAFGQDPAVVSLAHMCWILWFEGYPDQASLGTNRRSVK